MSSPLLQEVSEWKLEAKLEDIDRYFYFVDEVNEIVSGNKAYVIGRKGTGKTAISEYISRSQRFDTFTEKLTFKNFPFNELYTLRNESFNHPNQYITVWKFVIYSCVCKMMIRNENISSELRSRLSKVFAVDATASLSRTIAKWTTGEFGLTVLGSGL